MSVTTDCVVDMTQKMATPTLSNYQPEPGEVYMNPRQKAYLKQVLEKERSYWVDAEQRMISGFLSKRNIKLSSDPADVANREIEIRSVVRGREHRLIKKIDEALARLKAKGKQYGFCGSCHAEIGIKRLEIRPTANLCFDCKTQDEIRERRNNA